jgi:hypothetical protein
MLSSSSLHKKKEVLARNGGGNLGKKCVFVFVLVSVIVALEHETPSIIVSRLGYPFVSCLAIHKFICWSLLESMLPRQLSCHPYVKKNSNLNKPSIKSSICSYKFSTMLVFLELVPNHFILLSTSNMLHILCH